MQGYINPTTHGEVWGGVMILAVVVILILGLFV
jgi:hypothetical protein